jgi:hypothetical protein
MKHTLIKVLIAMAALANPVPLRLAAQQDQPQQRQELPASTAATGNYNFLIASGFLCDPNDSAQCPAVTRASDGETIEITVAGTLDVAGKFVSAAGAFTQKAPTGDIVTTGVWTATGLGELRVLRDRPRARCCASTQSLGGSGRFPWGEA